MGEQNGTPCSQAPPGPSLHPTLPFGPFALCRDTEGREQGAR